MSWRSLHRTLDPTPARIACTCGWAITGRCTWVLVLRARWHEVQRSA